MTDREKAKEVPRSKIFLLSLKPVRRRTLPKFVSEEREITRGIKHRFRCMYSQFSEVERLYLEIPLFFKFGGDNAKIWSSNILKDWLLLLRATYLESYKYGNIDYVSLHGITDIKSIEEAMELLCIGDLAKFKIEEGSSVSYLLELCIPETFESYKMLKVL